MGSNNSRVLARPYSSYEHKQNDQIVSILFHDDSISDLHSSKAKKIFDRYRIHNKCVQEHGIINLHPLDGYTKIEVQLVPTKFEQDGLPVEDGFRVLSYSWTDGDATAENWEPARESGGLGWHQFPNACIKLKIECTKEHSAGQVILFALNYRMVDRNGQVHYINEQDTKSELFGPLPSLALYLFVNYSPPPTFKL